MSIYSLPQTVLPSNNLAIVYAYYDGGLNILPIRTDGSKAPCVRTWKEYQDRLFPRNQLANWFSSPAHHKGIGIVCGRTSGGLEVLDFDVFRLFPLWSGLVTARYPGLLDTLPIVATPDNGRHVYYRSAEIEGNQPLAKDGAGKILIETRGQGGIAIAPGSPPRTHPAGRPYRLVSGNLHAIPVITAEQRRHLLEVARGFNLYTAPSRDRPRTPSRDTEGAGRPGDAFNATAEWADILEPHGWRIRAQKGEVTYWTKPGSAGTEHHATTGYCGDKLYVFSTSIAGFQAGQTYSKFAAHAILRWEGDFSKAATELAELGYGSAGQDYPTDLFPKGEA